MSEEYEVRLDAFSGPLDLLLHLIKENRLDIKNIPMAELTRQYLDYIEKSRRLDVEVAGEFLLPASTLLRIKSRSVLPQVFEEPEEVKKNKSAKIESREDLIQRLLIYRQFKRTGEIFAEMIEREEKFVKRTAEYLPRNFLPLQKISPEVLHGIFSDLAEKKSAAESFSVETETFKVTDKMRDILKSVKTGETELSEVVPTGKHAEKIAAFLAALELVNRGKISARQEFPYREIFMSQS